MRLPVSRRLTVGLLASLTLFALPRAGLSQKPEKVKFDSFDGVELHGSFYPGSNGKLSPAVILVNPTGVDRIKAGWDELARELQDKYSVLTFDFRGHGESDTVRPNFWTYPRNQKLKGAKATKTTISYKDFRPDYWPVLVNDILAAKRFLDQQNDADRCNSSNLIVIGADDGAALGAFYMTAEWKREIPNLRQPRNQWPVGGADLACAVWLGIHTSVRGTNFPISRWFKETPQMPRVPMDFLCSADDTRTRATAGSLERALKSNRQSNKLTRVTPVKEARRLSGMDLVRKSVEARADIKKYLNEVMEARGTNAPSKKDPENIPIVEIPLEYFLARGS